MGGRQARHSTTLRLPADVKAFLDELCRLHGSSQNSEIVRAIRERMNTAQWDNRERRNHLPFFIQDSENSDA